MKNSSSIITDKEEDEINKSNKDMSSINLYANINTKTNVKKKKNETRAIQAEKHDQLLSNKSNNRLDAYADNSNYSHKEKRNIFNNNNNANYSDINSSNNNNNNNANHSNINSINNNNNNSNSIMKLKTNNKETNDIRHNRLRTINMFTLTDTRPDAVDTAGK